MEIYFKLLVTFFISLVVCNFCFSFYNHTKKDPSFSVKLIMVSWFFISALGLIISAISMVWS